MSGGKISDTNTTKPIYFEGQCNAAGNCDLDGDSRVQCIYANSNNKADGECVVPVADYQSFTSSRDVKVMLAFQGTASNMDEPLRSAGN